MLKSSLGSLLRILAGTLQRKGGTLHLYRYRVMGHTVQVLQGSGTRPCCPPAPAGPWPHTASPWMLLPRLSVFSNKWTGGFCPGLKADSFLQLSHLGIISALQRDWLSFVAWSFSLCSFLYLLLKWFSALPASWSCILPGSLLLARHSSHSSHCSLSVIYSLHFSGQT